MVMKVRRIVQVVAGLAGLVVVLGAGAFWWAFVRDDAPAEARLVDREVAEEATTQLDGSWQVQPGPEVFAGYRIDERTTVGIDNTAVARTEGVTGTLVVEGTEITAVDVTADLTGLVSQDSQVPGVGNRDAAMRTAGLETDTFPEATFSLAEPIELGELPEAGEEVTVDAVGQLMLHGVTQEVTVPVAARWNGEVVDLTASIEVALADFDVEQPAAAVVTVADTGTVELQLTFVPEV
jgi:polyisoprenoid-binding protein YceI